MYEFFIYQQDRSWISGLSDWIATQDEKFISPINNKYTNDDRENSYCLMTIGNDSIEVFHNRQGITIFSHEDIGDGNVLLDHVISLLMKTRNEIRCLHLSNIKITP